MTDLNRTGTDDSVVAKKAAIYVRMSTEHQQYSTENQSDAIHDYAQRHSMQVVRTYADEGKSGLSLEGRKSLKRLISDVQGGNAGFETILVYDISRWGRFQDADESAYYEYICRRAGISVEYCAEQFKNDGSPASTIIKGVKRAMAGEYSRELSTKVFMGQCRLIQLGFRQGGLAGYGLRRMLVDHEGEPKGELTIGEQKSIQTDRVVLVAGPAEEVETVRWVYEMFVSSLKSESEIAEALNDREIQTDLGRRWNRGTVRQVLTNEKYIGNNVYNRNSYKLKMSRVKNPPEMWVRSDGAFEAIVDLGRFAAAQALIAERARKLSDDEMLSVLSRLYDQHGRLSAIIINENDSGPSSSAYRHRFGSLVRAYRLVGYVPERDYSHIETNRRLRAMYPGVLEEVLAEIQKRGATATYDPDTGLVLLNGEVDLSLVLSRCFQTRAGSYRWKIRMDNTESPDITVAIRMDGENRGILDYYLLPAIDSSLGNMRVAESNGLWLDAYRYDTLDYLFELARRVRIEDVA